MNQEELEGFLLGNPKRRQIVNALEEDGSLELSRIAKKKRIPKRVVEGLLEGLLDKGVVEREDDEYGLSEVGEKIVADSHKFESG